MGRMSEGQVGLFAFPVIVILILIVAWIIIIGIIFPFLLLLAVELCAQGSVLTAEIIILIGRDEPGEEKEI